MTFRTIPLDQLEVSELNVRTNQEDATAVDALARSIDAKGLFFPLIVHPLGKDRWGVLAGGRRLRAFALLVAEGKCAATAPIECLVRDLSPAEITELSLSENLLRRSLQPYEVHAAIARAAEQGHTADQIAHETGQRVSWVRRQLRLGTLDPEIFRKYSEGRLSADQAQAYASTEDQALQREVYAKLSRCASYEHQPQHIRAALKVGDRELDRLLRFVGADAYRAAGGRFELDLFADGAEERGRVVDEPLLRELAEAEREQLRTVERQAMGRSNLRFAAEPPQFGGYVDHPLALEIAEVRTLPIDADICATIALDDEGDSEVRYWWASRKAKGDAGKPLPPKRQDAHVPIDAGQALGDHKGGTYEVKARAVVKDEHGLSADGLQIVRSIRRQLLRALLMDDAYNGGELGRDYLVWQQLRQEVGFHRERATMIGARGLVSEHGGMAEEPDIARDFAKDGSAGLVWAQELGELHQEPWMTEEDPVTAFRAFVAAPEETKRVAAAVLAALSLVRSANAPGWAVPMHDELALQAGGTDAEIHRRHWTPDPAFLGLFPRLKRLELAQPHVGGPEFRSWSKLSDKVLTGAAAGALTAADGWLHPLLSFGVEAADVAPDVAAFNAGPAMPKAERETAQ